jgi:hypothetical protein
VNREELLKEATNQFLAGRKHLLLHDYKNAVSCLEHATRLYDEVSIQIVIEILIPTDATCLQLYGVAADECGDCYLHYGTALFELARQDSGVFDGCVLPANG